MDWHPIQGEVTTLRVMLQPETRVNRKNAEQMNNSIQIL